MPSIVSISICRATKRRCSSTFERCERDDLGARAAPLFLILPWRVGLSHMAEGCEKEVVIPLGLEHFVADARRTGCGLQDVEDQLSDKGEIFRRVILAAAAGVLVKQDVENPVKVVLDAPVGAHDLEQLLGWQQARGKKVSDRVLGGLAPVGAPAVNATDGSDAGEAVLFRQLWCRDDDSLSALDAAVGDGPSLARPRRPSGLVEQCADRLEELAAIAFDSQHRVPLPIADGLRRVGPAMQGVGGDKGAVQIEQREDFERAGNLIAVGSRPLSQCHAHAGRPDIDQMQRSSLPAAREGSAQCLTVDADHPLDGEALAEFAQNRLQTLRVQCTEDVAERIVAGNTVSELQEPPQQFQSAVAKELELGATPGASQRGSQCNDHDVQQIVSGIVGTRILEWSKQALELAHSGLPQSRAPPPQNPVPTALQHLSSAICDSPTLEGEGKQHGRRSTGLDPVTHLTKMDRC